MKTIVRQMTVSKNPKRYWAERILNFLFVEKSRRIWSDENNCMSGDREHTSTNYSLQTALGFKNRIIRHEARIHNTFQQWSNNDSLCETRQ